MRRTGWIVMLKGQRRRAGIVLPWLHFGKRVRPRLLCGEQSSPSSPA